MRNEIKFCASYDLLREIVSRKNLHSPFPPRRINSIYFDSPGLANFHESEEGSVPRKKVRFRWYGPSGIDVNQLRGNIEIKKTFENHREKETIAVKGLTWKELRTIVNKVVGGDLIPVLLVSYSRSYFSDSSKLIRYTLDHQITYGSVLQNGILTGTTAETRCVLELKTTLAIDYTKETNQISDLRTRFSKYCEGTKALCLD